MKDFFKNYGLVLFSVSLFVLGNIVYTDKIDIPWYVRSIFSEAAFIFMYTIIDLGNFKYKAKFYVPHIILLFLFYTPFFSFLFFSKTIQLFSISVSIFAIIVNSRTLFYLYNKTLSRLFSSKISAVIASFIEISIFSYLLHLGIKGTVLMCLLRITYINIFPRLIFR